MTELGAINVFVGTAFQGVIPAIIGNNGERVAPAFVAGWHGCVPRPLEPSPYQDDVIRMNSDLYRPSSTPSQVRFIVCSHTALHAAAVCARFRPQSVTMACATPAQVLVAELPSGS